MAHYLSITSSIPLLGVTPPDQPQDKAEVGGPSPLVTQSEPSEIDLCLPEDDLTPSHSPLPEAASTPSYLPKGIPSTTLSPLDQAIPPFYTRTLHDNGQSSPELICKNQRMENEKEKERENESIAETSNITTISYEALSRIYGIDFLNIQVDLHANPRHCFALREQILEIEKILQKLPDVDVDTIRRRILKIINEQDFELQMAELGLILYYLDRDGTLSGTSSLLEKRANEIQQEMEYHLNTGAICDEPLIPSSKTDYLIRTFVHMLFTCNTSSQVYNKGGLIALKLLLSRATYSVASFLHSDHLEHILIVIENIRKHPAFEMLFLKTVSVHPDLQDAIRIDLKLNRQVTIRSVHAFYAGMMALFSDIRQLQSPRCCSIGTFVYVSNNYTYKTFEKIIQWLEQGYYIYSDTHAIPLRQLLNKRLAYNQDLKVMLAREKSLALVEHNHSEVISQTSSKNPINEILIALLEANFTFETSAYKHNMLIQLQLSVLEFASINGRSTFDKNSRSPFSKSKVAFIDACMSAMGVKQVKSNASNFAHMLRGKLESELWLEKCQEKVVRRGHSLRTDNEVIGEFAGNQEALKSLLEKDALRVFHLKGTCYTPLQTLRALQNIIYKAIMEVGEREGLQRAAKKYVAALFNSKFRISLTNYLAKQINHPGINGKNLNFSDLLILKQRGGQVEDLLEIVYNLSMSKENVLDRDSLYAFLETLFERVKLLNEGFITNARKVMIRVPGCQEWIVSPESWKMFLNFQGNFKLLIDEHIFNPADQKYDTLATEMDIKRCIYSYTSDPERQEKMLDFFNEKMLTFWHLKELLISQAHPDNLQRMQQVIDLEFSKICINTDTLLLILNEIDLSVSSTKFQYIAKSLQDRWDLPFAFAHHLRAQLIEQQIAIVDPYQLELAICKVNNLPIVIELGNLNFSDNSIEDSSHMHLVSAFSWSANRLQLYGRDDRQQKQKTMPFDWFQIIHPKVREKPQGW